ncbi:MAG: peptidoglycan recognition family protein [Anaerolineae bacterium]
MTIRRLFDEYLAPAGSPTRATDAPVAAVVGAAGGAPQPYDSGAPDAFPAAPARAEAGVGDERRSARTGRFVRGPFLAFWSNYGATLCGEPLTDEVLIDGRRAQVFERLVLGEIGPDRVAPLDVGAQWLATMSEEAGAARGAKGDALVIADRTAELDAPAPSAAAAAIDGSAAYPRRVLGDIRYIVVHHTGAEPWVGPEAIARAHRDRLGWPGIGYHFVVDADGGVHQTQDLTVVSHHARQFNAVAVGVALCGTFDDAPPPAGQLDRAAALIAHLVDRLGLPLEAVRGHGELVATNCPGATYQTAWRQPLREAVARYAGRSVGRADVRTVLPAGAAAS